MCGAGWCEWGQWVDSETEYAGALSSLCTALTACMTLPNVFCSTLVGNVFLIFFFALHSVLFVALREGWFVEIPHNARNISQRLHWDFSLTTQWRSTTEPCVRLNAHRCVHTIKPALFLCVVMETMAIGLYESCIAFVRHRCKWIYGVLPL